MIFSCIFMVICSCKGGWDVWFLRWVNDFFGEYWGFISKEGGEIG